MRAMARPQEMRRSQVLMLLLSQSRPRSILLRLLRMPIDSMPVRAPTTTRTTARAAAQIVSAWRAAA